MKARMTSHTEQRSIDTQGRYGCLAYTLVPSRSAKRMRLRVRPAPDGSVRVELLTPRERSLADADAFVGENAGWVRREAAALARVTRGLRRTAPEQHSVAGPTIRLHGELLDVTLRRDDTVRGPQFVVERDRVVIRHSEASVAARSVERWLRTLARADITSAVARRRRELRVRPGRIFIRGQRTKWGNCSAVGNLSFNWRLVLAPPAVLDYVVVHELTHLRLPDHSPRFWLAVTSHCPRAAEHRAWLRDHRLGLALAEKPLAGIEQIFGIPKCV